MKSKIAQFLMLVGLTAGLAVFAQAQRISVHRVDIPFDFIVSGKTYTAGKYEISFGVFQNLRESFLLRSTDNKQTAIVMQTISKESNESIKNVNLVFNVSDGQHYLAEINTANRSISIRNSNPNEKLRKKVEIAVTR